MTESLSKRQLGQRARRKNKQLGRPSAIRKSFSSLTLTHRQPAQIEHANRANHMDTITEDNSEEETNVLGVTLVTNMQHDIPGTSSVMNRANHLDTIPEDNSEDATNVLDPSLVTDMQHDILGTSSVMNQQSALRR